MFGSSFLDIAIGIVFVFLMLSLIASTVNEIILSSLKMRGKFLLRGLKMLLDDSDATGLVKQIYNSGQIYGLFEGTFDPNKPKKLPSYIPPANFASALLDVVNPGTANATGIGLLRAEAVKLAKDEKTEKVGKPLVSMIDAAGTDLEKLKKDIEDWFNSAMDRVTGWYKYRTQWTLFGLGFALAVVLNANTIGIVQQLSRNPTLRESIVAAAQSVKPQGNQGGETLTEQIDQANKYVSKLEDLGIPLGWPRREPAKTWWEQNGAVFYQPGTWLGWFLTAVAVSLGAPFWFDILNKFMVARSTFKPQREQQSKSEEQPVAHLLSRVAVS